MHRKTSFIAVAAALVPLILSGIPASAESSGGMVTGSAWIDKNGDGYRQRWEPPMPNMPMMLTQGPTGPYVVNSDDNGNYRFDNIPAGQYVMTLFQLSVDFGFTRSGRDSDFDPCTRMTAPITVTDGGTSGPIDAGFISAKYDVAVTAVDVPELHAGDEVDIRVEFANRGNVPQPLESTVDFPAGLRPLSVSQYPYVTFIDNQRVFIGSMYVPDTCAGNRESAVIRAAVQSDLSAAELTVRASSYFGEDRNPRNNMVVRKLSTEN